MSVCIQIKGKNTTIGIPLESSVIKLKEKICEQYGFPIEQFFLSFKDQVMKDNQPLNSYDLGNVNFITLQTFVEGYYRKDQEVQKLKEKALNDQENVNNDKMENLRLQDIVNQRENDLSLKFCELQSEREDLITKLEKGQRLLEEREKIILEQSTQNDQDKQASQKLINKLNDMNQKDKIEIEVLQDLVAKIKQKVQDQDLEHRKLQYDNEQITTKFEWTQRVLNQREEELKNLLDKEQSNSKNSYQSNLNLQEATKLKFMVENLESEKQRLTEELRTDKQSLQMKVDEAARYKEELFDKKYQLKDLERDLKLLNEKVMSSQESGTVKESHLQAELDRQQVYSKKMDEEFKKLHEQNKFLQIENIKKVVMLDSIQSQSGTQTIQKVEIERMFSEFKNQIDKKPIEKPIEIKKVKLQGNNQQQNKQVKSNYQNEMKDLNDIIKNYQTELLAKQIAHQLDLGEISKLKKDSIESGEKIKELEQFIDELKKFIQEKDKKLLELQAKIDNLQSEKIDSQQQQEFQESQINQFRINIRDQGFNPIEGQNAIEIRQRQQEGLQRKINEKQQNEKDQQQQNNDELMAQRSQILIKEKNQISESFIQQRDQRSLTGHQLKEQMMKTHGKIEVCFLVDVTLSMSPFKVQAMKCIDQSISAIKEKTNRDVLWAAVAYQDFGELKKLGGQYKQIEFSSDAKKVQSFLKEIDCTGGDDVAEDIRGGMKQMVQKLPWSKTFKIAVLICDAPTHGKKYNGGVSDHHPNEDIEDAIEMLIANNIFLIGILFNKSTLQMFEQIKEIYKKKKREKLLLYSNLEGISEGKIWEKLVGLISLASQNATYTNQRGTHTKNPNQTIQSQDGAMEALSKTSINPLEFEKEPGIQVVETQFTLHRVEIKQESFEAQIENIQGLDIKRDFVVNKEGQWNCIRTQKPFAFGQMKAVYLMKRLNSQNEVYVVKMPLGEHTYKSLDEAIQECRSHLISKCLMKRFIKDLRVARDAKNPSLKFIEPQYSDFLILQENEKSFWIAERFFSGNFVKYNNNFGFVSDDDTEINHLAQAFTYYTFFVSNYNYMVSDVQGVGLYFTDPAVNTIIGSFDETDMGTDGQSMFVVAYAGKKRLGKEYLDLLGIKI